MSDSDSSSNSDSMRGASGIGNEGGSGVRIECEMGGDEGAIGKS